MEEKINWQLVDKYYPYFVKKMQIIDAMLAYQNYEIVYEEIYTAFIHISGEILRNKDTQPKYKPFLDLCKTTETLLHEYRRKQLKQGFNKQYTKSVGTIRIELHSSMRQIYTELMIFVSDLNMFFPKVRKDKRLAIYK